MLETTTSFLSSLAKNNNREWFADNKGKYLDAKEEFESFVEELIPMIQEMDPGIGHVTLSDCTYRIYRDTRFSADKTPYKNHFGAYINRHGKKSPYAGYYIHISPAEGSLWGGGLYCPEPEILKAVRRDIYENIDEFRSIIGAPEFKDRYTLSQENKLKKAPQGFPQDFPDIELLKHRHYDAICPIPDSAFKGRVLAERTMDAFRALMPLNRFLNFTIDQTLPQTGLSSRSIIH